MEAETVVITGSEPEATSAVAAIEETGELWRQQFSEAVTVMREVVAEVRSANQENSTLRQQVSELMQVNRDLTAMITETSRTQTLSLESLTRQISEQATRQTQTPLSGGSPTDDLESDPETVVIVPATVDEPTPEPQRPKRRAI